MAWDGSDAAVSKRNYYLMMLEGSLFWFGASFVDQNAVISVFLTEATGSMQWAGLAAALRSCAWFVGQFIMGFYMYRVTRLDRGMHLAGYITRPIIFFLAPFAFFCGLTPFSAFMVTLLLVLFYMGDGFVGLMWNELAARTLTSKRRVAMQGYQQMAGGLAGFCSAFLVKLLLDRADWTLNVRYGLVFACCGFVFLLNIVALRLIHDFKGNAGRPAGIKRDSLKLYLKGFVSLWREDRNFRSIFAGRALFVVTIMASALIVVFGRRYGSLTETETTSMIYLQVAGQAIGAFVWVNIAKRWGNNALMVASTLPPFLIAGLGLFVHFAGQGGASMVIPVGLMVFFTGFHSCGWIGFTNRILDVVETEKRSGYLVLQSLMLLPLSFLSYLASLLADTFSFLPVFVIVLAAGVGGLLLTLRLYKHRDEVEVHSIAV